MNIFRGKFYAKGNQVNGTNVGVANTGVVADEYGDSHNHVTKLTVSVTDALTLADSANLADGYLLYTLPAGAIIVDATYMSMAITAGSAQLVADTPDVGIGMRLASAVQAALSSDNAACENMLTGQAANDCNGTAETITLGTQLVIASGDNHTVYFNAAGTWSNDTSADLTADIAGTVTIAWRFLA